MKVLRLLLICDYFHLDFCKNPLQNMYSTLPACKYFAALNCLPIRGGFFETYSTVMPDKLILNFGFGLIIPQF